MYDANKNELDILEFWKKNRVFEKSIETRPENKPYVFYDGPPFATGLPHYGHIAASLMKDVVPRYYTMRGYRVERMWGWDCHGLPIENIIEKDLNLNTRKDILAFGIDKFNEACRAAVLKYAEEWKKTIERMGRWVDMEHAYHTIDLSYMESVWWVFKQLYDKKLVYKDYKPMHICPRCETALSNFEVTQGYKDVKDISAFVKFQLINRPKKLSGFSEPIFALAWTTTPWTLPGNLALAVKEDFDYVAVQLHKASEKDTQTPGEPVNRVESFSGFYIVAKERLGNVLRGRLYTIIADFKGKDLVDLKYEPLFNYFAPHDGLKDDLKKIITEKRKNAFQIYAANFVSTDEGTGIVHIAPAFGEDDFRLAKTHDIDIAIPVQMNGRYHDFITDFKNKEVKPKEDPTQTDVEIIKWLAHEKKLFDKQKIEHSYPHCWRCDSPLLNYVTESWFIRVTELKNDLLKNNEKINWIPEHMKHGRFGKWLEGAKDWAVSRSRYWGTPLPIWHCDEIYYTKTGETKEEHFFVFGSVKELEDCSGQKVTDLHKHIIDKITFACPLGHKLTDGTPVMVERVPEVLDCWFESGSMPYAQMHYPFENKEKFESGFPAEFIAEGQDQTRGWFYTLHVLATVLTQQPNASVPVRESLPAFRNVIVNGIVLAEDGKKMSKRLKNYPDPMEVIERYGADAMRFYLVSSPVMSSENLNFSETGVREVFNKVVNTVWNVLEFYRMFAGEIVVSDLKTEYIESNWPQGRALDRWILAKLQVLIGEVTNSLNTYKLAEASRPIQDFVTELSQWYVRRSRERLKDNNPAVLTDKQAVVATLRFTLLTLSKLMAPFVPFLAERVYKDMGGKLESVHLESWPEVEPKFVDEQVLSDMVLARKIVEMGLSLRKEAGIKVRQPLQQLTMNNEQLTNEFSKIIADEMNVKIVNVVETHRNASLQDGWICKEEGELTIALQTTISPELKQEGLLRELVRAINQMRKDAGLTPQDHMTLLWKTDDADLARVFASYSDNIKKHVLADAIEAGGETKVEIDGKVLFLDISHPS